MGEAQHDLNSIDLRRVGAIVTRVGVVEETGLGAGVFDDPVTGILWLVHWLADWGLGLSAGDRLLSASFVRPLEAPPGSCLCHSGSTCDVSLVEDVVTCYGGACAGHGRHAHQHPASGGSCGCSRYRHRCADPGEAVPAGASIAGAEPNETAVEAIRLGFVKVIAPFMFVYAPGLLLTCSPAAIGVSTVSAFLAVFAMGTALTGWPGRTLSYLERGLLWLMAALLIWPFSPDPFAAVMIVTRCVGALGIGIISWRSLRFGR